ncbi:MAG: periplasmic heavy metal sensor [Acidobacteriaceae bacterium]
MRIHSKIALGTLPLFLALPLAFAQNAAQQGPPPPPAAMSGQFRQHPMPMAGRARWGHDHGMRWRGRHNRQFMLARLVQNPSFRQRFGISAEQAQKIRTQTFDFRKARIENRADIAVKRLELKNQLSAENPDRAAIDRTLAEISAAKLAQAKSSVDFHLDMRATLTPDQWQKLRQMRQEFRHRGFHRGQNGFGPNGHGPAGNTNG